MCVYMGDRGQVFACMCKCMTARGQKVNFVPCLPIKALPMFFYQLSDMYKLHPSLQISLLFHICTLIETSPVVFLATV